MWRVARWGACTVRSATAGATMLENTWQVSMCRWHSSGRLARGGLRGTGSNGMPIHVGLKLRVRSVRFGMAVYAMHLRMPLISLVQYHPSVTRHSWNMCVSSTTPNSIYHTMSGFKLTLGHRTDAVY